MLEREGNVFPGLVWYGLSPAQPRAAMGLRLSLERDDQRLALWLDGDPATLLARLPPRPRRNAWPYRCACRCNGPACRWTPASCAPWSPATCCCCLPVIAPTQRCWGFSKDAPGRAANSTPRNWNCSTCTTPLLADGEDLHELDQLPIPVSFEVGRRTLDLHTLSTLQPGSLLDLDSALDGEVRILANQRCLGIGELVRLRIGSGCA